MSHFRDLVYNCLIILRSNETKKYSNQSSQNVRQTGMLRIRAIEQLRALLTILSKKGPIKEAKELTDSLRKKIIETMLYMMRTYPFCSISHGQGILVLNLIREAFDEDDLETMKTFVQTELEADNEFYYPSGKTTSRMNLGQIIKIALELKHFTQKALDDLDSDDEESN